jgi:hypothetical protein
MHREFSPHLCLSDINPWKLLSSRNLKACTPASQVCHHHGPAIAEKEGKIVEA